MNELFEQKFREWTRGKSSLKARLNIFQKIRDIPYAVIPELVDGENYIDILKLGKGSCTPKHFLLGQMYQRLSCIRLLRFLHQALEEEQSQPGRVGTLNP